jgi:hypothetical protein
MEGTTERQEGIASKRSENNREMCGADYFLSIHSGGESWNGVENGGERESGLQKGAPRGFHDLATS